MPRHVDHAERRAEILRATLELLAEQGPRGLTFRAVANRMGGSSTLVTHYFSSRQALLDALAERVADWPRDLARLETDVDDPAERLRLFLRWMVPAGADGYIEERARINLIGEHDAQIRTRKLFDTWDKHVRDHFRRHLEGLIAPRQVDAMIDLLRTLTNGLTLSAIEHPSQWPPERQFAVIDDALSAFGLAPSPSRLRS
jgi:AcrR family transcriptional regulator